MADSKHPQDHPAIVDAIETIENFIAETTGTRPQPEEIARALKRYFVLNEIKDHILMQRQQK
jgi:hypothetical protein